jgi:hypothetical protein
MTQSTPFWEATISSIAAIPISLNEQHKHPLGRERREVVCALVSGSDRVRDLAIGQLDEHYC